MKTSKVIFIGFMLAIFLIPINAFAQDPFYIAFKPGIYVPRSSDLDGFDTGFNGEISFGYRLNPNVAAELGIGYFHTQGERSSDIHSDTFDIDVVPVTVTLKAILPVQKWEFFGLGGGGLYFTYGPFDNDYDYYHYDHHHYNHYHYDYDTLIGGYLGAGIHYYVMRRSFVGIEGKYLWTTKAEFENIDLGFHLDGILANAVLGFRF